MPGSWRLRPGDGRASPRSRADSGSGSRWSTAPSTYHISSEGRAVPFSAGLPEAGAHKLASFPSFPQKPVGPRHPQGPATPETAPSRGLCREASSTWVSAAGPGSQGYGGAGVETEPHYSGWRVGLVSLKSPGKVGSGAQASPWPPFLEEVGCLRLREGVRDRAGQAAGDGQVAGPRWRPPSIIPA